MKREANLYDQIAQPDNIRLAFWKASRGKQTRPEVIEFKNDFETNIQNIYRQFKHHDFDIGYYHFFYVRDPKVRHICAASFPERIVHHAVMNICEPILDKAAIYDSYACRKQKGTHKALNRAYNHAYNNFWHLKLDIRKYFDSIDKNTALKLLARKIKDQKLLRLFEKILATYQTDPGKGLPIGNLISQHLANFYLSPFDHWIKEDRKIKAYIRYMDDFVLFSSNKKQLKTELNHIRQFLLEKLQLTIKGSIQLNRCAHGIPFLGYRVFPHKILLAPRSKKRFVEKFKKYEHNYITSKWSVETLTDHMEPLIDFTRHANSAGLRRDIINQFGVSF